MTRFVAEKFGSLLSRPAESPDALEVDLFALLVLSSGDTMKLQDHTMQMEMSREARTAALGATRQMLHEDEMDALTGALIDCGALPRAIMCDALETVIQKLIAKARGQLATEFELYPAEIFERVRKLSDQIARLRS